MPPIGTLILAATYALLGVTVISTGHALWRVRSRQQFDIFLVAATLGGLLFLTQFSKSATRFPATHIVIGILIAIQPYCVLRLVRHFRSVPAWLTGMTLGSIILWISGHMIGSRSHPVAAGLFLGVYYTGVLGYAGGSFWLQAGRSAGVSARRLRFLAVASWLFVVATMLYGGYALAGIAILDGYVSVLIIAIIVSFYLGLATPRRFRRAWQHGELYRFLVEHGTRSADERSQWASDDLSRTALRITGAVDALVLQRDPDNTDDLIVVAATQTSWRLARVPVGDGILRNALNGTRTLADSRRLNSGLTDVIGTRPRQAFVIPISSDAGTVWGVLIALSEGTLFADDDMEVLTVLSNHAASGFEHAAEADAREDRQRTSHARERYRLESDRQRLVEILEAATDFVTISQIEGPPLYLNRAALQAFEIGEHEELASMFSVRPPEYEAAFTNEVVPALLRDGVWKGETEYVSRSGRRIPVSQVSVFHQGTNKDEAFVSTIARDITERRSLENQLRQSQKMEAIGQLAGGVAHDFNNILTAIMYSADELQNAELSPDVRRELTTEISTAATRAADLTRQLLAFGRGQVLKPKRARLSGVVRALLPMLRRLLGADVEIVESVSADEPEILADISQLEQIVLNLAVNARDAMPSGGRLSFTVSTRLLNASSAVAVGSSPGLYAVLEVTDNGTGMDEATATRIFEPFFTTKGIGRGTGLGLSTVYGIMKRMHGAISVTSTLGQGTTFSLLFPGIVAAATEPEAPAAGVAAGGTETILVVEDEASVRLIVTRLLTKAGYRVLTADGPAAARQIIENTSSIDLLLTDVRMPGGNGVDLAAAVLAAHPTMAVVFMSGYGHFAPGQEQWLADTDSRVVSKPFAGGELSAAVREALDARTQRLARRP
jgi:PAS domain S-box-containing protein